MALVLLGPVNSDALSLRSSAAMNACVVESVGITLVQRGFTSTSASGRPVSASTTVTSHTLLPAGSGGSAGTCSGVFALDFNAWMASHPVTAPAAGTLVCVQAWFRDPPSPKATSLSDALRFVVAP